MQSHWLPAIPGAQRAPSWLSRRPVALVLGVVSAMPGGSEGLRSGLTPFRAAVPTPSKLFHALHQWDSIESLL